MVSSSPRPHFTLGKDLVPILQEAGWAPGPVRTGGKSRPHRDSIPDRPARSSVAIPTELPNPHLLTVIYKYIKIYSLTQLSVKQLLLKIFHIVSHSLTRSCVRLYILYIRIYIQGALISP